MPNPAAATAPIMDNTAPLPPFQQLPSSFQLSLSPYTDYVDPPPVQEMPNQLRASQRDNRAEEGREEVGSTEDRLGFIIDRVTDAPPGDGTLRLVGYHMNAGQVIRTCGKGMSCIISAVSSSIKHGYFIFGEQEVVFSGVTPEEDMLLVLRFYHWPGGSTAWAPWQHRRSLQPLLANEEWAAAWTVLRLTRPASHDTESGDAANRHLVWNTGVHNLPLYHSPAPPALSLSSIHPEKYREIFEQYGNTRVRFCVFSTIRPDLPFPPGSPVIDNDSNAVPESVYIPHSLGKPVMEPFAPEDGITLYIDGARFLPDVVTVTRVTGRIFDKNFDQFGPDISTGIDLNSDIFNPFYNYSVQMNSANMPPTSTLLLKVYTIDRFSRDLALVGWAAVNLFVEPGTRTAPILSDPAGDQVSLNRGAHQIRLYHRPPPTDRPFSVASLASHGCVVPCSTLLVRIKKSKSQPQAEDPMKVVQRPEYSQGVYLSDTASPTPGEVLLYSAMVHRSVVQVREMIPTLAASSEQMMSDVQLSDWVQKKFSENMKEFVSRPFKLCCVSQYLFTSGVTVSLDMAVNMPWSGFTLAHICFNPPGAVYYGNPWMMYDRAVTVEDINLHAVQNCPVWQDGFKTFTHRVFHKYLTLIIHLHEVVTRESDRGQPDANKFNQQASEMGEQMQEFRPGSQAWTAMTVFYKSYCEMGVFQLPLYQGAPTLSVLHALRSEDCRLKLEDLEQKGLATRIKAASVIVRIADGRRMEEMEKYNAQDISQIYLPEDVADSYIAQPGRRKLLDLVPAGDKEFKKRLVNWYRKYLTSSYHPSTMEGS